MARKVVTDKDKARMAELIGLGLTYEEAAQARGFSESTADRLMKDPVYRRIADDVKAERTSMRAQVGAVLRDMLTATDKDGRPLVAVRKMAADTYAKNPGLYDALGEDDFGDELLPGVVMRFPHPAGE